MDGDWTDAKIILLISLYESNVCLYDITYSDYRNRDKKRVCTQNIAALLEKTGYLILNFYDVC